jgi:hypothetical protein
MASTYLSLKIQLMGTGENSGGWGITPSGTTLFFSYNGTNVATLDSSENLIVIGDVTAFGFI